MVGQLEFSPGGRGRGEVADLYGLEVLRVRAGREGFLAGLRLDRAGRTLRRAGISRTLLPRDFRDWGWLEGAGLSPVDPGPLLRRSACGLALEHLRRRGLDPARETVALSAHRAGPELVRAAAELCPRVRRLAIAAPGGEGVARLLRREFGLPILPPDREARVELRFHPGGRGRGERTLELFGCNPRLEGIAPVWPALPGEAQGDLSLLCALWEEGKMGAEAVKFR